MQKNVLVYSTHAVVTGTIISSPHVLWLRCTNMSLLIPCLRWDYPEAVAQF